MFNDPRGMVRAGPLMVWAIIVCTGMPSIAAVTDTTANISTTVQELIDGVPGSVNGDNGSFANDVSILPIFATGSLRTTDLEETLIATGQGLSQFSDPNRLNQDNPEEIALEVGCYSNGESVAYDVVSTADETRSVLFTTPGNPAAEPEITFAADNTRRIESRVFLSGAVIFWANEPQMDLTGMSAEISVTVTREDTGATLFASDLTVAGATAAGVTPTTNGPIRMDTISLSELADDGVDSDSLSILQELQRTGTLILLAIPAQEHPYTYTVTADVPVPIKATMRARVRNLPGGTGVTATLGRPFSELASFIAQGLPGLDGEEMEDAMNRAVARRAIGLVAAKDTPTPPGGRLCGTMGSEMMPIVVLGLFLMLSRRR